MSEFNQAEYIAEFKRKNIKQIKLDLNRTYDADIIEFLDTVDNRSGFIKDLIRLHMNQGGNATEMPPLTK